MTNVNALRIALTWLKAGIALMTDAPIFGDIAL